MFERFTKRARTVVVHAQEIARERRSPTIGSEHLLLGLYAVPDGLAAVKARGLFYPELAVLTSLAFAAVVLALAAYEFRSADY